MYLHFARWNDTNKHSKVQHENNKKWKKSSTEKMWKQHLVLFVHYKKKHFQFKRKIFHIFYYSIHQLFPGVESTQRRYRNILYSGSLEVHGIKLMQRVEVNNNVENFTSHKNVIDDS